MAKDRVWTPVRDWTPVSETPTETQLPLYQDAPTEEVINSSLLRRAADVPLGILKGGLKLGHIPIGIADMGTGGAVGKFLEDKVGMDFKATDRVINQFMSPETLAAQKKVSDAKGFSDTVSTALANPSAIAQAISESVPSMLGGGAIGKGLLAAGSKYIPKVMAGARMTAAAPTIAGAAGEGTVMAGQSAEDIRQESANRELSPYQSVMALGTGVVGGLVGGMSGTVARRLGISDIDTVMVGTSAGKTATQAMKEGAEIAKEQSLLTTAKKVAEGVVTEGALEEVPQSVVEQVAKNSALGKPLDEGVANAAAMGFVTGGAMGGGMNVKPAATDYLAGKLADRRVQRADEILALPIEDVNGTTNTIAAALQTNPAVDIPHDEKDVDATLDAIKVAVAAPGHVDDTLRAKLEDIIATGTPEQQAKAHQAMDKIESNDKTIISKAEGEAKKAEAEAEKIAKEKESLKKAHQDAVNNVSTAEATFATKEAGIQSKLSKLEEQETELKANRAEKGKGAEKKSKLEAIKLQRESLGGDLAIAQRDLEEAHRLAGEARIKAENVTTQEGGDLDGQMQGRGQEEIIQEHAVAPADAVAAAEPVSEPIVTPAPDAVRPSSTTPQSATFDMLGLQQTYEAMEPRIKAFGEKVITKSKDLAHFTKQMVAKFGKAVAEHAKVIWEYLKGIQPGLSIESMTPVQAVEAFKKQMINMTPEERKARMPELQVLRDKVKGIEAEPKSEPKHEPKKTINIYHGTGENPTLSNFAHRPFKDTNGNLYHSVEHAYQVWKSGAEDKATNAAYNHREKLAVKEGKHFEGKITGKLQADKTRNLGIMKSLMKTSFKQNPAALKELLATSGSELTHLQDKGVWKTEFPRLLMEIREELKDADTKEALKSTSQTPVFDTLPSFVPGQQSMTYAGIGSRETPGKVMAEMTKAAEMLQGLGYTLNSGGAQGADTAFEKGAGTNKMIVKAKDATDKTRAIAKEIHPNPAALKPFPLDLMARNTNQVFGEKLDTPVDFVLCYTQDGAETSRGKGGTGQAMDMAIRKGIPVINMAKSGWEERLQKVIAKPKEKTTDARADEIEAKKEIAGLDIFPMDSKSEGVKTYAQVVHNEFSDGEIVSEIKYDRPRMERAFEKKAWMKTREYEDGSKATPYPENYFASFGEFFEHQLLHEAAHAETFKKKTETQGQYEDRINDMASSMLSERIGKPFALHNALLGDPEVNREEAPPEKPSQIMQANMTGDQVNETSIETLAAIKRVEDHKLNTNDHPKDLRKGVDSSTQNNDMTPQEKEQLYTDKNKQSDNAFTGRTEQSIADALKESNISEEDFVKMQGISATSDYFSAFEDDGYSAKIPSKKDVPIKDVAGQLIDRMDKKSTFTNRDLNEILSQLESTGLFSPTQSEILRDDVERHLDEIQDSGKEMSLSQLMSKVKEVLSLEEQHTEDGVRADWLEDVLSAMEEGNEQNLAEELNLPFQKEELRAPEFRTVQQANSYSLRKSLTTIDANSPVWVKAVVAELSNSGLVESSDEWIKKAMSSQAFIKESIKRDNKLIASNTIMLRGLQKKLENNKSLKEYNKDYYEDGELVFGNEIKEFIDMLGELMDYGYDIQPITSSLFSQYSSFDAIESLPMADLTELFDRLTVSDMYVVEGLNEEADLSAGELEDRYLTAKYGHRDTVKKMAAKDKPITTRTSLKARYASFRKTIGMNNKAFAVIDAYLQVIDKIMAEPYNSAHKIDADTIVEKLTSVTNVDGKFVARFPQIGQEYGKPKESYNKTTKKMEPVPGAFTYTAKAKAELRAIATELRRQSYLAEHHTQDIVDGTYVDETMAETIEAFHDLNGEASGANILETPKDLTKDVNVSDPIIPIGGRINLIDIVYPKEEGAKTSKRITILKKELAGYEADIAAGKIIAEPHSRPENSTTVPLFRYIEEKPNAFGKKQEIYFTEQAVKLGKTKGYVPMKEHANYKVNNQSPKGNKSPTETMWGTQTISDLLHLYERFVDDSIDSPVAVLLAQMKSLEADRREAGDDKAVVDEINKWWNECKDKAITLMRPARNEAMKKMMRQSRVLDAEFFAKLATSYNKQLNLSGQERIKEEDLFKIYEDAGYNVDRLFSAVSVMANDVVNDRARNLYNEALNGYTSPLAVLKADLSPRELRLFNEYVKSQSVKADNTTENPFAPKLDNTPDASSLIKKFRAILDMQERIRLIVSQESEASGLLKEAFKEGFGESKDTDFNSKNRKSKEKREKLAANKDAQKQADLERLAKETGVEIISNEMAEQFVDETFSDAHFVVSTDTDVSEYGAGLTHAEGMRSPIAQMFFQKLADIFGADLVLVTGHTPTGKEFSGKYVPKARDGRPKIVINPFMKTGLARVFAHELFHHIFNKVSATGYKVFKEAMMASVDKKLWDDTVRKTLIEKGHIDPAEKYSLLKSFEYNQMQKMSTTGTVVEGNFKHNFADRRVKDTSRIINPTDTPAPNSKPVESSFKANVQDRNAMGTDQITSEAETYAEAKAAVEEEIYANIFAQAFHQKTFWDTLAKTIEGQSIAAQLLVRAAGQASKIIKFITTLNEKTDGYDHMNNRFISSLVTDWSGRSVIAVKGPDGVYHNEIHFEGGVNQILADLVAEAMGGKSLRDLQEKEFTESVFPYVRERKQSILSSYIKNSKGTTGYRSVMTAIEGYGNALLDLINAIKPDSWFADYRVDAKIMRIMQDQNHAGNQESQEARGKMEPYRALFKSMTDPELRILHDNIVREPNLKKQKENFDALPQEMQDAFNAMKEYTDAIHTRLVELGLLKEGQKRVNHYGQTIKWFMPSQQAVDDSMMSFMASDSSKLMGGDEFTGSKSKRSTDAIASEGFTYTTIDPIDMFTRYVEDATRMITLANTLKRLEESGLMARSTKGGKAIMFEGEQMLRIDDPALRAIHRFNQKGQGSFKIRIEGHPEDNMVRSELSLQERVADETKRIWDEYSGVNKNWLEDMRDTLVDQDRMMTGHGEILSADMEEQYDYPVYSATETQIRLDIINKVLTGEEYKAPTIEKSREQRLNEWLDERQNARKQNPDQDWHYHGKDGVERQFATREEAQAVLEKEYPEDFAKASIVNVQPDSNQTIAYYKLVEERYHKEKRPLTIKDKETGELKTIKADFEFIDGRKDIGTAQTLEDAQKRTSEGVGIRVKAVPVWQEAQTTAEHAMYFDKDVAKLMNVILSQDAIRGSKYGNKLMGWKNTLTMMELSLSPFHLMTITQELVASQAAVARTEKGFVNKLKAFDPKAGFERAREIKLFFKKVISNKEYSESPEAQAEMMRLIGSNDVTAYEIWSRFAKNGGMFHQDESVRAGVQSKGVSHQTDAEGHWDRKAAFESIAATNRKIHEASPNKMVAYRDQALFHMAVTPTAHLMEEIIPRVKFAAFAREYAAAIAKAKKAGKDITEDFKSDLARDTMKFVEDRFGEVNWKNMWLSKTNKTVLQAVFRSFTWVAGSWKAMVKSGFDLVKWGWFNVKYVGTDQKYELADKGYWGIMAIATHLATVQLINMAFAPFFLAAGDDGEDDDEAVGIMTRMLFPRTDPYDNTKRMTFGSYPAEVFKHLSHLGIIGDSFSPSKLWTGRLAGPIGKAYEIVWSNETFDGVTIHDSDDPYIVQIYDSAMHALGTAIPMSVGGAFKESTTNGVNGAAFLRMMGFSNAPASTMRSRAANIAFEVGRQEYKGKKLTDEDMETRNTLKRAMRKYSLGDKSDVNMLLAEGKISKRQLDIAVTRYPTINNKPNPLYKDQLSQAMQRLTVEGALKVYPFMTEAEKVKHTREIEKKINNMRARKDTPLEKQKKLIAKWKELKAEGL